STASELAYGIHRQTEGFLDRSRNSRLLRLRLRGALFIKPAEFFQHPLPAASLVLHCGLKYGHRLSFSAKWNILDCATENWASFKIGFLGQITKHLEFRINSGFELPVQLQHQPFSINCCCVGVLR